MEIKRKYFEKYLHTIAIEQLRDEYLERNYSVFTDERIGEFKADLVVKKDKEIIIIEVKSGKLSPDKKQSISNIGNYIKGNKNYRLLIAVVTLPSYKNIEIVELQELIAVEIETDIPDNVNELSENTVIDEISDVEISELTIDAELIHVKGDGVLGVTLNFGSREDGLELSDSFPFSFELNLEYDNNNRLQITEIVKMEVDTSQYYE